MRYLLDTNIVSELRKGTRCDPAVMADLCCFNASKIAALSSSDR